MVWSQAEQASAEPRRRGPGRPTDYVQVCGFESDNALQRGASIQRSRAASRSASVEPQQRQRGDGAGQTRRPGDVVRWQPQPGGNSDIPLSVAAAVRSVYDSGMMLQPVKQELDLMEQKLSRQIFRLQEQSERFLDILVQPLEAKVSSLESRFPAVDCQLAELIGFMRGVQDSVEMQVRRTDAAETRCRKLRQFVEDEVLAKHAEFKVHLEEVASQMLELVTRQEILGSTDRLKQELKELVTEAVEAVEGAASRQELVEVAGCIRDELSNVELSAVASRFDDAAVLKGLNGAIQKDVNDLKDKAARDDAAFAAERAAVRWELQQAQATQRQTWHEHFTVLAERTAKSEGALEDARREISRLRKDISELKALSCAKALTSARNEAAELLSGIHGNLVQDLDTALLRLTTVEQQQTSFKAQIAMLENQRTDSTQVSMLEGQYVALKHQIATFEERQAFLRAQVPTLEKQHAALKAQVPTLEKQQASLLEEHRASARQVEALEAQLAALQATVQAQGTLLDESGTMLEQQATLRAQVALIELQQVSLKAQVPAQVTLAEEQRALLKSRLNTLEGRVALLPLAGEHQALKAQVENLCRAGRSGAVMTSAGSIVAEPARLKEDDSAMTIYAVGRPNSRSVASLPSVVGEGGDDDDDDTRLSPKMQSKETAALAAKAAATEAMIDAHFEINHELGEFRHDVGDLVSRMDSCESDIAEIKRRMAGHTPPTRSLQVLAAGLRPPAVARKFPNLAEAAEAMLGKPGRPQGFPVGRQGQVGQVGQRQPEIFSLTPGVTPRNSPDTRNDLSSSDETTSVGRSPRVVPPGSNTSFNASATASGHSQPSRPAATFGSTGMRLTWGES